MVETPRRKGLLRSKTFWANLLGGVVSVGAVLVESPFVMSNPQLVAYFATGMAVLNVMLRLVSSDEVTVTGN